MRVALVLLVTALLGCEWTDAGPGPQLDRVVPSSWVLEEPPPELIIHGDHFIRDVRSNVVSSPSIRTGSQFLGWLGDTRIPSLTWSNNQTLVATPPSDLPPGRYDLRIRTPAGRERTLPDAVEVGVVLSADQATATFRIPPVDPDHSVLFFSMAHSSPDPTFGMVLGRLEDDGEHVVFERQSMLLQDPSPAAVPVRLHFTVIEHPAFSVRRGVVDLSNTSTSESFDFTPGLDRVDHAFPLVSMRIWGEEFDDSDWVRPRIRSAGLAVELTRGLACCSAVTAFQVVEVTDDSAYVESGSATVEIGNDYDADTLAQTVPLDQSLLFFTHRVDTHQLPPLAGYHLLDGRIEDDRHVIFSRYGFTDLELDVSWYLLVWDGMFVQHGTEQFAIGEYERRVPLSTAVDAERSVAMAPGYGWQGKSPYVDDDYVGVALFTVAVSSAGDEVILYRDFADGEATISWSVAEFSE